MIANVDMDEWKPDPDCRECGGRGYNTQLVGSGGNHAGCRMQHEDCRTCGRMAWFLKMNAAIIAIRDAAAQRKRFRFEPLAPPLGNNTHSHRVGRERPSDDSCDSE